MPDLPTIVRDWASIDVLLLAAWVLWIEVRRRSSPAKEASMIEYFYILTISWTDGRDLNIRSRTGIATADEGQAQEDTYTRLFENTCGFFGAPKNAASVTYYYLARNET